MVEYRSSQPRQIGYYEPETRRRSVSRVRDVRGSRGSFVEEDVRRRSDVRVRY